MKPILIGYDSSEVYAVILWIKDFEINHKTKCFNEQDVQDMMDKRNTPGSLYSSFDGYEIEYPSQNGQRSKHIC